MSSTYQTDLNDIQSLYSGNIMDVSSGSALQNLNSKLSSVTTSLSQLQDIKQNALSKQNDVKNIVDSETKRLADKKEVIDKAMESQKRIIFFNDNSRKRYSAYLNIVITVAITLFILFLLRVSQVQFSFIPEGLFIVLYIIVISVGIIFIYQIYSEIRKHNSYNFDELNFNSPPIPTTVPGRTDASGNPFDFNMMGCVGESCCDEGTTWDKSIGKCINPALTQDVEVVDSTKGSTTTGVVAATSPSPTLSAGEVSGLYGSSDDNTIDYTNDTDYGGFLDDNKLQPFTTRTSTSVSAYPSPLDAFEYKGYTSYK
jgi:hypothetical protein